MTARWAARPAFLVATIVTTLVVLGWLAFTQPARAEVAPTPVSTLPTVCTADGACIPVESAPYMVVR